jgi:PAS domain S-box-containing protein
VEDMVKSAWQQRFKNYAIQYGFWIAFLMLVGSGIASYANTQKLNDDRKWVIHTYKVIKNIQSTFLGIIDTELERRGYTITGDRLFLKNLETKIILLRQHLQRLRQLTQDNPSQQSRLDIIEPSIDLKISLLKKSITLEQQEQNNKEIQAKYTLQAKELRETLEAQFLQMQNEEVRLLDLRSQSVETSVQTSIFLEILGTIVGLSLFAAIYILLRQEIEVRRHTELDLHKSNENLEQTVRERTAQLVASESRFRLAFINAPLPVTLHIEDKEFLLVNQSWTELSGYTIEDIPTLRDWTRHVYGEKHVQIDAFLHDTMKLESAFVGEPYTAAITNKQGEVLFWEYYSAPLNILPDGRRLWITMALDITKRKKAEDSLKLSQNHYVTLAESVPVGIFRTDMQGKCIYVNQRWCEITGLTFSDALGTGWASRLHPEDRNRIFARWQASVLDLHDFYAEYRFFDLSGKVTWVYGQAIPEREDGIVIGYIGSITDISDRKQAEIELQQAKADLELRVAERTAELYKRQQEFIAVVENSPNAIARIDRDMRYLYVNPATERRLGLSAAELIGKTGCELGFPDKLVEMANAAVKALLNTGKEQHYEIEQPLPGGVGIRYDQAHIIPEYAPNGEIATMLMTFNDITENKLIEIALSEANRRWQSLLDNIRLIVVGLGRDGNVEYVNPFFLDMGGYRLDEVLGKNWFSNFLPQIEKADVNLCFLEILENDFHPYYQNSILTKTGEERIIAWNNTLLRGESGDAIGTLSIGEDITEKIKIEQVKSEFISVVSHELRTPLASIRGALGLLSSGALAQKPDIAKQMLEIAAFDTERLVRLVNDILDLERLESNKITLDRQWYASDQLCQQAIQIVQAIAVESQIQLSHSGDSLQVWADRDRILQTLVNFLSNAIKFSPPHGEVHLWVEPQANAIVFHVRDRGRGIPANNLESIFERFNQVDASDSRQKGGTGLGLAICRSIVQQHGGKIWVESVVAQGSTFSFTIPNHITDT